MPNCVFRIGDKVRRRPGTLGAMGEVIPVGEIIAIETRTYGYGALEMLTVRFASTTETFYWDVYEMVEPSGERHE